MLLIIDVRTARVTTLRDKVDPVPMLCLRVSPLGQYILIMYQDKPPEIYSPDQGLLTSMSSKMPVIADVAWSGRRLGNTVVGGAVSAAEDALMPGDIDTPAPISENSRASELSTVTFFRSQKLSCCLFLTQFLFSCLHPRPVLTREQFVVVTFGGEISLFSMENSVLRLSRNLVTEFSPAQFTRMAWKHNVAILGDSAGTIFIWNLKVGGTSSTGCGELLCMNISILFPLQLRLRRSINTPFNDVRDIVLAPSEQSCKALVQFGNGEFSA